MKEFIYRLKRPYHFVKTGLIKGFPAKIKYKSPDKKLKIIAITGTDGKTTSSTLLYHLLQKNGKKVALISTVAAYINDKEMDTGFHVTSPAPDDLYKFMDQMVKEEIEYLVLEFTSQGAYQSRLFGIKPEMVGVTNIAQDHFDYHLNYDNYLEAKAIGIKKAKTVVLNEDDTSHYKLKKMLPSSDYKVLEYSQEEKISSKVKKAITDRFPEEFNQMNARLVSKMAAELGLTDTEIAKELKTFKGVPGRMQEVPNKKGIKVIVDFAHTPQGLEAALKSMKQMMKTEKMKGRLIVVHGSAGLRDADKRPMMGKISTDLADLVVFTAEDPRTEDVWAIIRQMKENLQENHDKIISIIDRQEAINFAIQKLAKRGDLITVLGKGPEKSMCYGTEELPWSDLEAVKEALK